MEYGKGDGATLERAASVGLSVSLIDEWYDVDTWEDVVRLKMDLGSHWMGVFIVRILVG